MAPGLDPPVGIVSRYGPEGVVSDVSGISDPSKHEGSDGELRSTRLHLASVTSHGVRQRLVLADY